MNVLKVWEIKGKDETGNFVNKHYVSTKDAAVEWKKHNDADYVKEVEMLIFDSYDELTNHFSQTVRARALSKLTEEERKVLGV
jgi:transcription termination factor NusB